MDQRASEAALQCLEVALHPTTVDGEAMAAVYAFRRKAKGTPLGEICVDLFSTIANRERYRLWKSRVQTAEGEVKRLKVDLEIEKRKSCDLEARLATSKSEPMVSEPKPDYTNESAGHPKTTWTDQDYEFLARLYEADPKIQNIVLATKCSRRFGRIITTNSIGGALDRLRKRGRLPKYREGFARHRATG